MNTETEEKKEVKPEIEYARTVTAEPEYRFTNRPTIQMIGLAIIGCKPGAIKLATDKKKGVYVEDFDFNEEWHKNICIEPRNHCDHMAGIVVSRDYGELITDKGAPTMESMARQFIEDGKMNPALGEINPACRWVRDFTDEPVEDFLEAAGYYDHWMEVACTEYPGLIQRITESFMVSECHTGEQIFAMIKDCAEHLIGPVHYNLLESYWDSERLKGGR